MINGFWVVEGSGWDGEVGDKEGGRDKEGELMDYFPTSYCILQGRVTLYCTREDHNRKKSRACTLNVQNLHNDDVSMMK